MKTTRSEKLFKEACELIPGGVNSPVRACLGVGADPLFIASAKGSHVTTVDGQEMIDFVESWGPMLLGHSHPEVTKAVVEAAGKGTSPPRSSLPVWSWTRSPAWIWCAW